MIEQIEIKEVAVQPLLCVRFQADMSALGEMMGQTFPRIAHYVQEQGGQMAGMPLSRYYGMVEGQIDIECAIPVAAPLAGADDIQPGELGGGRAVVGSHFGPYETLNDSYGRIAAWMTEQGLQATGPFWEVYVSDPEAEPDPSKWRTDIYYPVD